MKEIRWHGRGGNGAFTAAKLLGHAASVYGNKYAQAFPSFGPERRGAPVRGFTRIDDEVIRDHSQVYTCDAVFVLDETLCEVGGVFEGLKDDTVLVMNTTKTPEEVKEAYASMSDELAKIKVYTLDATQMALDILGRPIVNTILLGAGIAATGIVELEDVLKAVDDMMGGGLAKKNKAAVEAAYKAIKEA